MHSSCANAKACCFGGCTVAYEHRSLRRVFCSDRASLPVARSARRSHFAILLSARTSPRVMPACWLAHCAGDPAHLAAHPDTAVSIWEWLCAVLVGMPVDPPVVVEASPSGPRCRASRLVLDQHRDFAMSVLESAKCVYCKGQELEGMALEELRVYDVHSVATAALSMFRALIPSTIAEDEVMCTSPPLRVRLAVASCVLVALKFEDDMEYLYSTQLATSIFVSCGVRCDRVVDEVCEMELRIATTLDVFWHTQKNHHRRAVEHVLEMAAADRLDRYVAHRAIAVVFVLVYHTHGEVAFYCEHCDTHVTAHALVVAALACLECAHLAPVPRTRWETQDELTLAHALLTVVGHKIPHGTNVTNRSAWERRATCVRNIQCAMCTLDDRMLTLD